MQTTYSPAKRVDHGTMWQHLSIDGCKVKIGYEHHPDRGLQLSISDFLLAMKIMGIHDASDCQAIHSHLLAVAAGDNDGRLADGHASHDM